jgi:hypothetical protein
MAGLTASELKRFDKIGNSTTLTFIVVADNPRYPIVYGNNSNLTGYSDLEIRGLKLSELLDPAIKERHGQFMEEFKKEALNGVSRQMGEGKVVPCVRKNGQSIRIKIDIAYLSGGHKAYFLAFLQPEGDSYVDVPSLYNLRGQVETMLINIKSEFRRRVELAGGGVVGVATLLTTLFTPIWPAVKVAFTNGVAAFTSPVAPAAEESLTVTAPLTREQRGQRLNMVRDNIRRKDAQLAALAYYRIEQTIRGLRVYWVDDTETPQGQEVWFFDAKEDKLTLTIEESEQILRHDCVIKTGGAALINQPGQPRLDLILCPTFTIKTTDQLPRVVIAGVMAGAYYRQGASRPIPLEPHSTALWELSPSLETAMGD